MYTALPKLLGFFFLAVKTNKREKDAPRFS